MVATWWLHGGYRVERVIGQVSSPHDGQETKRKEGVDRATDKILFKSVMVSIVILTHSRVTWEESQ